MLKMEDALPRAWERENANSSINVDIEGNTKISDICDAVTPLAKLPYQQQLDQKSGEISQLLKKLVSPTHVYKIDFFIWIEQLS